MASIQRDELVKGARAAVLGASLTDRFALDEHAVGEPDYRMSWR
ncbi:hypothetical protein [Streptomyces olivochromogenes]|nr:hypothetical protein [Streptomyces olivochromogenes]